MRETQQNIKRYKKQLLDVKSKIAAAGLFFLMSCVMMTTATFAWLVLSTAPEVSNISTTIAGNGNLEIALAGSDETGSPKRPEASKVGDGKIEDVLDRNLTWGNLVNLNDNRYGLHEIVLRPATLNRRSLLSNPLRGVVYAADGRLVGMDDNFAYTNYDPNASLLGGAFIASNTTKLGVRAISSVKYVDYEAGENQLRLQELYSKDLYGVQKQYIAITENSNYMNAISGLMGVSLTNNLGGGDGNCTAYVEQLYLLFNDFYSCMENVGELYAKIANLQNQPEEGPFTLSTLMSNSESTLKNKYDIVLPSFDAFKTDYNTLKNEKSGLDNIYQRYQNSETIYWGDLSGTVNKIVHVDSTQVNGTPVSSVRGASAALSVLDKKDANGEHNAVIYQGLLWKMEERLGVNMYVRQLGVSITYKHESTGIKIPLSVKANVYTSLRDKTTDSKMDILFDDVDKKLSQGNPDKGTPTAKDIYGMALDFWIRTNASDTYLTLEGEPKTETVVIRTKDGYLTYKDSSGTEYYFVPKKDDKTYQEPSDPITTNPDFSKGDFLYASSEVKVEFSNNDEKESFYDDIKIQTKINIIGYDGENRVWEEGVLSPETSTTQGLGSCYIFYPEDPVQQDLTLELLEAMTVVFIDDQGTLLAYADMKPNLAYVETGKVTVPLELRTSSTIAGKDENGNDILGITPLVQGEAKLITALVYIDGERITNDLASATNNINGFLNLQFGSSISLESMSNDDLFYEEMSITASISDEDGVFEFNKNNFPQTKLSVNITGIKPNSSVIAKFNRKINDVQGVVYREFILNKESENTWSSEDIIFTMPGNYELRSVWIDGIEYELTQENPINVTVTGLSIDSVSVDICDKGQASIFTSNNSQKLSISVGLAGDYAPQKVQAIFMNDNNDMNTIVLSKESSGTGIIWSGDTNFYTSGLYKLRYIVVDGEYYDIANNNDFKDYRQEISLQLGVTAKVRMNLTGIDFVYKGNDIAVNDVVVELFNDKNVELKNYQNVYLAYASGSNTPGTDVVWNAEQDAYVGVLNNTANDNQVASLVFEKPGVYNFKEVTLSNFEQSITKASSAPTIRVISSEPPTYSEHLTKEYQFAAGASTGEFVLNFNNVSGASMVAIATSPSGVDTILQTKDNNSGSKYVSFPITSSEEGTWTLKEIRMTDVYVNNKMYGSDSNSSWYVDDNSENYITWYICNTIEELNNVGELDVNEFVVDSTDNPIITYIIKTIHISVYNNNSNMNFEGEFTELHQLDGSKFSVKISDSTGNLNLEEVLNESKLSQNIISISDQITLTYDLDETTSKFASNSNSLTNDYWWTYDGDPITDNLAINAPSITLTTTDGVNYTSSGNITMSTQGTYKPELSIKINGVDYKITTTGTIANGMIKVDYFVNNATIKWDRPDIKFVNVTNKDTSFATFDGGKTVNANNTNGKNTISDDGKTVKVFSHLSSYSTKKGFLGSTTEYFTYKIPTVYMQLTNLTKHSGVTIIINNTNPRSPGTLQDSAYKNNLTVTFSSNTTQASTLLGDREEYETNRTLSSTARPNVKCIGDNSTATIFTVSTSTGAKYTFKLNGDLLVDYDY